MRKLLAIALLGLAVSGCRDAQQGVPTGGFASSSASNARTANPQSRNPNGDERPGRRRSRRGKAETEATPGQFDFYLLNLSWSPEFCATHNSPECGKGLGFVVHGLWPQDATGDYPEDCSDAPGPANPTVDTDVFPTVALVEHEWQTHGTCSGLSADGYFNAVHTAFHEVKLPEVTNLNGDSPETFLSQLQKSNPGFPPGSFALSCGNNRLTAVEVCLDKGLRPEACQGVRSCRAEAVAVTPR